MSIIFSGFDGALNIEEISRGFVSHLDFSKPFQLNKKFDWVLSIEVGEHIPKQYEDNFIQNLIRHACKGILPNNTV